MAGGKNFDFKHKNPADVKTPEKKEISNDKSQGKQIKKDSTEPKSPSIEPVDTDIYTIKPKSEPRTRRVQLLLTERNYSKLKEYASNGGTSVNDAVNQMIEKLHI